MLEDKNQHRKSNILIRDDDAVGKIGDRILLDLKIKYGINSLKQPSNNYNIPQVLMMRIESSRARVEIEIFI